MSADVFRLTQENVVTGTGEDRPPEYSDDALALRFAERNLGDLRYVSHFGRWLRYDGKRWDEDSTLRVFDQARKICREAACACHSPNEGKRIASAKTVAAVERLARSDRKFAASVEQWDADPWLLNTPKGTVDLRSGKSRTNKPEDYCTHITAVGPQAADCPLWKRVIARVTGGDTDLVAYLQRFSGYALTGDVSEHVFAFTYGTGANGKSVFLNTLSGILGDYAKAAPIEAFTASNSERHPTELASLRGARLVTAVETEEGKRWAESRIKILTGGDKVSARHMRQDFFEFSPQFKLIIAGNYKPSLRNVNEAMRRRLHLIPFGVTIPPEDRDPDLTEKLKPEWPAILHWALEGCLDWQQQGLRPPEAVRVATDAYFDAEDATAAWIVECCVEDANAFTSTSSLFDSWRGWAERAGEYVGPQKRFVERLEARGLCWHRTQSARGFYGLKLKRAALE